MNQTTSPASEINASNAVHPISEDLSLTGQPKVSLEAPSEFVVIVTPPQGVFAPIVVTVSEESALALAAMRLLPGPAKIVATLSVEGLAALRLPKQPTTGGFSPQNPGRVVFAPDGGPASLRAAQHAARRAKADGWSVDILPAPTGARWVDVHLGRAKRPEEDLARIYGLFVPPPDVDPGEGAWEPAGDFDDGPT